MENSEKIIIGIILIVILIIIIILSLLSASIIDIFKGHYSSTSITTLKKENNK